MLADSKLPTTFWAEAVNTACYDTLPIAKHSEYSTVEENLHVQFSENTSNIAGSGPNWLFDIDALTNSMNYKPVVAGNQSNGNAGTKACDDAGKARMETVPGKDYILLPMWPADPLFSQNSKESPDAGFKPSGEEEKMDTEDPGNENEASGKDSEVPSTEEPREDQRVNQELDASINSTNNINTASDGNNTNNVNVVSSTVNAAVTEVNVVDLKTSIELPNDLNMPELEDIVYSDDDEDVGAEADMNNLDAFMPVSPIPTTRIHKDHPVDQIIGDLNSAPQTRRMTKNLKEHGLFSSVQQRTNHKDFQNCLFACFLSQEEPKKKFGFSDVKTASTPMETHKPLLKDADGEDVDEHMYRSMIGSLMYLTSSRPDIMFDVCVCARFQVNPKVSHLHAVKRIFRYLKGQPKLGLWYPKDSPFNLVAYTDSDYAGASLYRKSTTGEAEYVAALSCCGQVLWIQNQLLDYGYNFMHTKIYIDNESTICIVKNLVFYSKTKHIEIRHHFIRDSNEKKLIQIIKIHTDKNVPDLLTKAFDVKGCLEWNEEAAKDEIRVSTCNLKVSAVKYN
ncbi:hypothetical protein Tco_1172103 [Tanacetum coccineum]